MYDFSPQGHEHHAAYVRQQAEELAQRGRFVRSLHAERGTTPYPRWHDALERLAALLRPTAAHSVRRLSNAYRTEARQATCS